MDDTPFTISHHGATAGVTGSCHQLTLSGGEALLVDCGLFQGTEETDTDKGQPRTLIDFPLDSIQALLVTHCHIDHVGRIPYLMAAGFDKPIYATEATAQLLPLVIEDAVKVGISRDTKLVGGVLQRLRQLLRPMPYNVWFPVESMPGTRARFQVAGHILGSAYIECDIRPATGPCHRVLFSGDLGAPCTPLLPAPRQPWCADTLVLESTYGDRNHQNRRERRRLLEQVIERSLANRGTILIPAFSIGRTQELLYEIEDILHHRKAQPPIPTGKKTEAASSSSQASQPPLPAGEGWAEGRQPTQDPTRASGPKSTSIPGTDWPTLPIVLDSPLAARFTEHYRSLSALWDQEARTRREQGRHPLAFEQLITIDDHAQHNKLVQHLKQSGRPAIVIAASGMCAGGRIVNYLKALLPDPRTEVLFCGYQAKGTPGRDIQLYGPMGGYVQLDGEKIDIKARIHTLNGYSAHADQSNLIDFVARMVQKPREIRLVHGDDGAKQGLAKELRKAVPECEIIVTGQRSGQTSIPPLMNDEQSLRSVDV